MALAKDRNTQQALGDDFEYGQKGSTTIYAGALVMIDASGRALPGAAATGQIAAGRAQARSVNAGADFAVKVKVRRGAFWWKNSTSTDEITVTEIGEVCYIVDDETVAKTDGSSARSAAGKVLAIDANMGVLVSTGIF